MLEKAQISVQPKNEIMYRGFIKPITPATVNEFNVDLNGVKSAGTNLLGRLMKERTTTESEYFYTLDDGIGTDYEDESTEKENVDKVYRRNCVHGKDCGRDRDDYSEVPAWPSRTNRQRRRSRLEFHFSRRNLYRPNVKRNPSNNYDQIWQYSEERIGLNDNACALHCFVDALKMTDDTGFPNKHLVRQVITKDIEDQELKDFLQQSADDCFQILRANKVNKCEFSKNLLICLTDKGKANCDDLKSNEPGMVAGVPKAYQYTYIKYLRP
ncbi:hypothetical protein RR48_12359 [Papilio machaon]|uniref:Uncharacterized protein n=1 Tax=Papilio machaon TaxID=76193 RepID=A0A194QYF2_PAPMA|nr:hypothetical protein RR48_12359 [Papilio machaon]